MKCAADKCSWPELGSLDISNPSKALTQALFRLKEIADTVDLEVGDYQCEPPVSDNFYRDLNESELFSRWFERIPESDRVLQ